jgi:hypothetical protein
MRIRTILKAAAVPAIIAGGLLATTAAPAAHAAVGSSVCTGSHSGTIPGNIVVPAGQTCDLQWAEVTGNVTVYGHLKAAATTFDGNVTVTGSGTATTPPGIDGSGLELYNGTSHIRGNLTVTGSGGYWGGNMYGWTLFDNANQPGPGGAATQVDGNLTFTGNTGALYTQALHVGKNFTASGDDQSHWTTNDPQWTTGGLAVSGTTSVS